MSSNQILLKAVTEFQATKLVNNKPVITTASASATGSLSANLVTTAIINNAILNTVNQSNTSAIYAGQLLATKAASPDAAAYVRTGFVTRSGTSVTPWYGGVVNGYFMWQGNFVNLSPTVEYFANNITQQQTWDNTTNSYITSYFGAYNYSSSIITSSTGVPYNAIFMFSGNSNVQSAIDSNINYTDGTNNYTTAANYLIANYINIDYPRPVLMCLTIGGGYSLTGSWNGGKYGAMYSLYKAVTTAGVRFSYVQSGNNEILVGTGTGTLFPLNKTFTAGYNSICLDIETWGVQYDASGNNITGPGDELYGSSGQDFLDVCKYIKKSKNSTYYKKPCVIIMTVAHSCSNYNGTGKATVTTILSDTNRLYEYFSPQMYTVNIGTTNEYGQNSNLTWSEFVTYLNMNSYFSGYIDACGNSVPGRRSAFLLPALNYLGLLNSPGSNQGPAPDYNPCPPNLYWYQSSSSSTNPPEFSPVSATVAITYPNPVITFPYDTGVENFFNAIIGVTEQLGGSIQWVNGTVQPGVIERPYPWKGGKVSGMTLWNTNIVKPSSSSSTVYYYNNVTAEQDIPLTSVTPSNLTSTSSTFKYSSTNIPFGTNMIHLYTNNSNAEVAVAASGVNKSIAPFLTAYNYFHKASFSGEYIMSLALGGFVGAAPYTTAWDTGLLGAIYSIYESVTKLGTAFSYTETGTGYDVVLTGTGKQTLSDNFNGLLFDIQQFTLNSTTTSASSGQDFINLFQYIKYNPNSIFSGFQMIITVAFLHTGPYWQTIYDASGAIVLNSSNLIETILQDATGNASGKYSYDLLAPEFFTQENIGSMNEYCTSVLTWTGPNSFLSNLQQNYQFNKYSVNMITPLLVSANLATGPGSNITPSYPNNYWFQSSSTSVYPPTATAVGYTAINYTTDTGSAAFFNEVFESKVTSSGGYIQWMNGTLM